MKTVVALALCLGLLAPAAALACDGPVVVCDGKAPGVALIAAGHAATVYVDAGAPKPVLRVAADFADDLGKVSGTPATVVHDLTGITGDVVIIGQVGQSPLIDGLIRSGKLKTAIAGQWEAYTQAVVDAPASGIRRALVIAGADPRGAIYGTYDISAKMGVSPWYWWADVPVAHKTDVSVLPGTRSDKPVVKYRGFFINDEEPSFGGWAREKFGGINHQLYAKVFELDLRLKGNYLWPAMWGKAIAADDPQSLDTADEYGIVLGTSHHEPMTRAQDEWHRHTDQGVTGGKWDYTKNADNLRTFWRGGMERAKSHEYLVTVGMRGDGDEPMTEGTATQLLETIVADQRKIIADVTGKPADQTPQVWALYKEVQDYYDHGMKVPDDVTLLFSDDNWGQIRRLPDVKAAPRLGGYGIYYHFDYVGGPRNYKWINTNQIEKTWQQMELAHETGADRLWVVNVGDLKPMEYPLSFFLDMAWNPDAITPDALKAYPQKWAAQQFGKKHAAEMGELLTGYSKAAARRKPELIDATSFGASTDLAGDDFSTMTRPLSGLMQGNAELLKTLPENQHTAWYELAGYEIQALDTLYDLYGNAAHNRVFAAKDDPFANYFADEAQKDFKRDGDLSRTYNSLLNGKWSHVMDQTHIGYKNWQQPDTQAMPSVERLPGATPETHLSRVIWVLGGEVPAKRRTYKDDGGYVAIEAEHYARKVDGSGVHWQTIPDLGRTLSSVLTLPQAAPATEVKDGVRLEYDVTTAKVADATLNLYLAPTLDTAGKGGLRLAVAIDDRPAQTLSFNLIPDKPDWNAAVEDNILVLKAPFPGLAAGKHTVKIYRLDGNVVLERLVLDTGGLKPSYLGPPESVAQP